MIWRRDYPHPADALADDGKSPRYPGGRCVRADCWPCTVARLDAGTPVDWPGRARMAASRREAGLPLDELDLEALRRADKMTIGHAPETARTVVSDATR